MKRTVLFCTFTLLLSAASINAQTFSFTRISPPIVQGTIIDSFTDIPSYATLKNLTNNTIVLFFRRYNFVPIGWETAYCVRLCYPPNRDTSTETLNPHDSIEFSFHFYPYMNPGIGYGVISAYNISNPSERDSITFGGRADPIGIRQLSSVVKGFSLNQNYPNPFNPTTKIRFTIEKGNYVDLTVFDILGREVKVLLNQQMNPGEYEVEFDATGLASGMYYYRLRSGEEVAVKKMTLVK
jgi:hypothetical protein